MAETELVHLSVAEIMRRWPATSGVFIDLGMHCVGCPIGVFQTPIEAAAEHDLPLELLLAELSAAIDGTRVRGVPAGLPPRSGKVDAVRGQEAFVVPLRSGSPSPRQ
jgi:hybrid cluster-associated redox disulfide protein